jgi:hypothetical protein
LVGGDRGGQGFDEVAAGDDMHEVSVQA